MGEVVPLRRRARMNRGRNPICEEIDRIVFPARSLDEVEDIIRRAANDVAMTIQSRQDGNSYCIAVEWHYVPAWRFYLASDAQVSEVQMEKTVLQRLPGYERKLQRFIDSLELYF